MICRRCERALNPDASFCDGCGTDVRTLRARGARTSTAGDGFDGGVTTRGGSLRPASALQVGGDLVLTAPHGADSSNVPTYEVKWSWRSPLTQARIVLAGATLGALCLLTGYAGFRSQIYGLDRGVTSLDLALLVAFGVFVALLGLAIYLGGVVARRTQHFGSTGLLPVLTGWGGRIGVARFTGKCHCGGRLRFYNKPVEWIDDLSTGRRRAAERTMGAECVHNPRDHWWRVDSAEAGSAGSATGY